MLENTYWLEEYKLKAWATYMAYTIFVIYLCIKVYSGNTLAKDTHQRVPTINSNAQFINMIGIIYKGFRDVSDGTKACKCS
jgi:hypothetical protein